MEWKEAYVQALPPTAEQMGDFVGSSLWNALTGHIEEIYGVRPKLEYSKCTMQAGWNVKYRKGTKALCTLYPDNGFFTCLVSVPERLQNEAEFILLGCTEYTRGIYEGTRPFSGGRWLMLDVKSPEILEDVKRLLELRARAV